MPTVDVENLAENHRPEKEERLESQGKSAWLLKFIPLRTSDNGLFIS